MLPKDNVLEWHKMFLEYIERDDEFANYFNDLGYIVVGND